jgi:hypothetical protein
MKNIRLLIIVIVLVAGAGIFAMSIYKKIPDNIFCFLDIGTHHPPGDFIEINGSTAVGQTFVPSFSDLFKVSVFVLKNEADPDSELIFHLRRKDSEADLVTKKFRISEIEPRRNDFYQIPPDPEHKGGFHYHIQFPVIRDSKDKEFYFYLEAPGVRSGKGIKLGIWKVKYYEALRSGSMYINQKPSDYFIAFRTFNTWIGTPGSLLNDIKERLSKDKPFAIFYASIVTLTIIGILLTVRAK